MMKRIYFRIIIPFIFAISVALILFFIFRNQFLTETVSRKVNQFNKNHQISIHYKKAYFEGFATIGFDSLLISSDSNDTLLFTSRLSASLNLWQLATKHISFRKLIIGHAIVRIEQNKIDSYFMSSSGKSVIHPEVTSEINLYERSEKLLHRVFGNIPSSFVIKNASFTYSTDSAKATGFIEELKLKNGILESTVSFTDDSLKQIVHINGTVTNILLKYRYHRRKKIQ
jgi:hypothetical protein